MAKDRRHNIRENLLLALDTLRTHKFRSFLTILGVLIGTMTVISVASIFKGLDQQMVERWRVLERARSSSSNSSRESIPPDARGAVAQAPDLRASHGHQGTVPVGGSGGGGRLFRAPRRWPSTRDWKWTTRTSGRHAGRLPQHQRRTSGRPPLHRLRRPAPPRRGGDWRRRGDRFFAGEDPIGKVIQVDGHSFEVIGTWNKRKAFPGNNGNDRIIFVPYFTYRKSIPMPKRISSPPWRSRERLTRPRMKSLPCCGGLRGDKPSGSRQLWHRHRRIHH